MTVLAAPSEQETLTGEVLAHLDAQVASAERLLEVVLQQGAAIRARDVHAVVRFAGLLHGEMSRREAIESERSRLLARSRRAAGDRAQAVTLTRLSRAHGPRTRAAGQPRAARSCGACCRSCSASTPATARSCSLELSFLDHLMTSLALDGAHGYDPRGSTPDRQRRLARAGNLHVLDLRA